MSFNKITIPAYHHAIRLMFSYKSVSDGMQELDKVVTKLAPHPIWDKVRKIRFDDELPKLTKWVRREVSSHQKNISILFFCLSDMGDVMTLEFLQQTREPKSENDWEAFDERFWSDAPSGVLKQMYQLAESELSNGKGGYTNSNVRWIIETCYPLAYAGLTIGEIMQKLPIHVLLGKDTKRRIAVFFGEGDDFFFGEITEQGFKYYGVPNNILILERGTT